MPRLTTFRIALHTLILAHLVLPLLHAQAPNTLISVAGGGGLAGGPALSAALPDIGSIASDGHGSGYGVSSITCVVYKYDPSGNISVFAGNGVCNSAGDGGPATQAELRAPIAVTVGPNSNVYVADLGGNVVRMVNVATGIITTVAGNGNPAFSGEGGPATQAGVRPNSIAFDPHGNLYIGDGRNHVIRRVDAVTGIITTIAGIPGQAGYSGDGGLATAALAGQPVGLVFDAAGNLFFAELVQCTIRRIDAVSGIITRYAGNLTCGYGGDGGPALNAVLHFMNQGILPQLAFDLSGNLLITDQANNRVRQVTTATGVISTIAGTGTAGFSGDNGPATSAQLNFPSGILVNNSNQIFVADSFNSRVRRIDTSQTIITFCGNGSIGDGGPATSAILSPMNGVTHDTQGNLYIGDSSANLLRKVDTAGNISTIAGIPFLNAPGGDGGPASAATLGFPSGLAFDGHGNLFIADPGNSEVRKISTEGVISTYAGNAANPGNGGDGGPATQAQLLGPFGLGFDASDNLYIADLNNTNVRRVEAVTHVITTVAGNGTPGCSGNGGPATAANLGSPSNVKVDSQGNLFIADFGCALIWRVDHSTGIITTFAGNGSFPLSGDGGPATAAGIGSVWGLAFDGAGNLFLTDDFNQAIRRIDAVTGTISTIAGNNGCNSFGIGGPALQASFCAPADLFIDSGQNLFFADSFTRRIYEITGFSPISSIMGSFSDFGLVSVGTTSLPETITINNTGSATLNITNLTTTGNFGAALTCNPASVAPMQSCGVQAFFNPAALGPQLGTLSFATNDPAHPAYNFNLSGTGFTGATLGISPSSLAFGSAIASTTTPAQTVTVSNTGETSVSISSIATSGANSASFGQTNNCPISPALLLPGNSCQIFVTFTPLALGANNASLVITDTQGVFANTQQSISLSGTGTDVPVVASTSYSIGGNAFTSFSGSAACPPDCNVSGSFSLPQPLAPNLSNATITPASFSFTVGTTNLNQSNVTSATFTNVSTDASGSITSWAISLSNANFSIVTNNASENVTDSFTIVTPQGSASNNNSPATWPKTVVTPLTFPPSNTPVSNVAVVNCPSGTTPCTDPNAHSMKLTVQQVSNSFTLTVTSYEVPLRQANGVCENGQTESTDFDCRFVSYFPIQTLPNGNVIVPQCVPYSNGNCVFYRVGNTPSTTTYQGPVIEYIAWNNSAFVPPPIYQVNNPRLYDDPSDPPYDVNHQFVFDITNYYQPTGEFVGVDAGISGQTNHFNDFVVAYPGVINTSYSYSWLPPLKGSKTTQFAVGASIPVRFHVMPDKPTGVALLSPNHLGYSVLLDTSNTGCTDFTGLHQPVLTLPSTQTNFVYDAKHQEYDLKLAGIYKPGNYKLLVNSNLLPEQCAVFQVTGGN
jgi:sugar lactone lactonase YvrE